MKPLCFILVPFGKQPTRDGRVVDFGAVYAQLIKPAVEAAGLEPLRADEEVVGGVAPRAMFERLMLCEYAVADLTAANANVFYQLGMRHAQRPQATQFVFAEGWGASPFDVSLLRALPYRLDADGTPAAVTTDVAALTGTLLAGSQPQPDSPLIQLIEAFPEIQRLKTDVFRDRVRYAEDVKAALAAARRGGVDAVAAVEASLGDISHADVAVVVDLLLSYRAVKAWQAMIALVPRMAPPLAVSTLVREQLGLALNRAGQGDEAEAVLRALIAERGASSETCSILGRVLKDRWEAARDSGNAALARGLLDQAIAAYLQGFEADWRDAFPGINAVTLMALQDALDPRQAALLPVVSYAVERRMAAGQPDYWDYATRLELAVLARDAAGVDQALADALAHVREVWEPETTARNLALIASARKARGEDVAALERVIEALNNCAAG